jgi:thiamine pyrophosphate-dependent acetolactate synthase large subunit-like protein
MPSWTVRKTGEFAGALDEMMNTDGPAMIHIVQDPRDVSPYTGSAR